MDIYLQKDGQQQGPFSENRIRQGIDAGEFAPADLAWTNGKASWQSLASLISLDINQPPPIGSVSSNKLNFSFSTTDDQNSAPPPLPLAAQPSNKNTLRVSKTGSGDFVTVTEAIAAALPGTRIMIEAGIYEEALFITKPLTLIGKQGDLIVIHNPDFTAVKVEGTEAIFQNITFVVSHAYTSISLNRARVEMDGCKVKLAIDLPMSNDIIAYTGNLFSNTDTPPFLVSEGSNLLFMNSSAKNVLIVCAGAKMVLAESTFHCCAVAVKVQSKVEANDCAFTANISNAPVFTCEASTLLLRGTKLIEVYTAGILCAQGSHVTTEECAIEGVYKFDERDDANPHGSYQRQEGYPCGIVVGEQANLEMNTTSLSSLRYGIFSKPRENASVTTIHGSKLSCNHTGIYIQSSFTLPSLAFALTVHDTEIFDNEKDGIWLYRSEHPPVRSFHLRNCKIRNNRKHGAWICVWEGTIEGCEFSDNAKNLWCDPFLLLNHVRFCKGVGDSGFVRSYQFVKNLLSR